VTNCPTTTQPLRSPPDLLAKHEDEVAAAWLRPPQRTDGAAVHRLISECPPLDLNSLYSYLLLCEHFSATSVVAGRADAFLGFISGYLVPGRPDTLFVWQVAVHADARGQRLGKRMLAHLLHRPGLAGVRYIETTVGPDNGASRAMFASLARLYKAPVHESPLFDRALFGAQGHDDEPLLRIGPLQPL